MLKLWPCYWQCRTDNLGDRNDTYSMAFFCPECYPRARHRCEARIAEKKKYNTGRKESGRVKRRGSGDEPGDSRHDARWDNNTMM